MNANRDGWIERTDAAHASRSGSAESEDPRLTRALKDYLAALEAGARPDRREFLARHPSIAADLAVRLDGLEFVQAAAAQLPRPANDDSAGPGDSSLLSPGRIGDFRIVRVIGRGGMGTVYEAEQLSLGRRVALKVLPFAAALDPRQLQRFKCEAQAAAQLHHTNIVPIYAVGCDRGVHYYAMQYIEGQSLCAVIREMQLLPGRGEADGQAVAARQTPGEERPRETALLPASATLPEHMKGGPRWYRRVARLGMKAAEALDHAHQVGVVHRDVKPANLLLDTGGNLWITDFGLALFHRNNPGLTVTGEVVGTLRYMSPEQALARRDVVDHRTDIYSLGATLYELLTLRPVFEAQDRQELMHQIAADEPRRPRQHDPQIPRELETVLLKALAKDPAERYATAQELADDLERFLQDRPVLARRPTLVEWARKWARRHRSLVVSAVAVLTLSVIGSLVSTYLIAQEHFATKAAYESERLRSAEAQAERVRAEQAAKQARRVVDFFTRLSEEEMPNGPSLNAVRRRMLEAALTYYQEFIDQSGDDPRLQSELAASRRRVEVILAELSALEGTGQLILLGDRAVQDDLGLTSAQRARVKQLADNLGRLWRESPNAFGAQDRRRSVIDLARTTEAALPGLLTADQSRRLKQLILQLQTPWSFSRPEVVEALQLTSTQREAIRGVQDDLGLAKWNCFQGDGDRAGARRKVAEMKRNASAQVLRSLTEEQQAAWRNLTGAPFHPPGEDER